MKHVVLAAVLINLLVLAWPTEAITFGQVDRFNTDTQNWSVGSGNAPSLTQEATGGVGGSNDGYLQIHRDSSFHVATFNTTQWAGDYSSENVKTIAADFNVIATDLPLGIRIVLYGPGGSFTSKDPVPVSSGWRMARFGLTDADLVPLAGVGQNWPGGGTGILADTLAAVSRLQIRNDARDLPTSIGGHPQHVIATLGIDNIRAIPEPTALSLLACGAFMLCRRPPRQ